jgi:hypothetical protein
MTLRKRDEPEPGRPSAAISRIAFQGGGSWGNHGFPHAPAGRFPQGEER